MIESCSTDPLYRRVLSFIYLATVRFLRVSLDPSRRRRRVSDISQTPFGSSDRNPIIERWRWLKLAPSKYVI